MTFSVWVYAMKNIKILTEEVFEINKKHNVFDLPQIK